MSSNGTTEFSVGSEASARFALLSGDYNPLHLDPLAARRTQFGSTVVHGIHLVLGALDRFADVWQAGSLEPVALSATFSNPVRTGSNVRARATPDASGRRIRFAAESEERPAFSATLDLQPREARPASEALDRALDRECAREAPRAEVFPPAVAADAVPLSLGHAHLAALFPALARTAGRAWIADLLATTRIVGMRCPGMNSIYSSFRLQRAARGSEPSAHSMHYRVERSDARFNMIRMTASGAVLAGTIEAFFRPQPVEQLSLQAIAASVMPRSLSGQQVLVVGGSRGLGELTAKIVAAGGADVTITYARGAADAEHICAEASALGFDCKAKPLDVTVARGDELPDWLATSHYSHVYFFASPPIARNPTPNWNHTIFEQLALVYVRAFALLAGKILRTQSAGGHPARFLYPSSIFVAAPEKGFAEYAAAKAAGEALCDQLAHQYQTVFAKPRLPRMRTDQTSALADSAVQDAFPVMHELVRNFHSR